METKTCNKCGEIKSIDQFRKFRRKCKICCYSEHRIYNLNNKAYIKEQYKKYYAKNRERRMLQTKEWKLKNKDHVLKQQCVRRAIKYNITKEEYENLFLQAGGKCSICAKTLKLNLDHDHKTGTVRNLLCRFCNLGIGHFDDNPDLLIKASEYLNYYKSVSNK